MTDPTIEADALLLLARLGSAVVLGGLLGLDREVLHKPAGVRTHMLVALGASLVTLVTSRVAPGSSEASARTIAAVVVGVGFLGAGTILHSRRHVRGLTTAATVWVTAALGIACGHGMYKTAGIACGFALVVNVLFRVLMEPAEDTPASG